MRKKCHCFNGLNKVTLEHTEDLIQQEYKERSSEKFRQGMSTSEALSRDYSDASIYRQRITKDDSRHQSLEAFLRETGTAAT